jgi:hypothetical protein
VQGATAKSKIGIGRGCGLAEAPPGFQAGWSDCMIFFFLDLFISLNHLEFSCTLLRGHTAVSKLSPDFCSDEVGVFFVALGILEPKTARQ